MEFDVQPIYGWGWSFDTLKIGVPAPFRMTVAISEQGEFKTATGKFDAPGHPLSGMWIVLSPIQAGKTWEASHLCAFPTEPSIPADLKTLVESAPVTGFAKAFPL